MREPLILPRRVIRKTSRKRVSFGQALKDSQELAKESMRRGGYLKQNEGINGERSRGRKGYGGFRDNGLVSCGYKSTALL